MVSSNPTRKKENEHPTDRNERALAEAVDGLAMIRDEGPPTEPVYPTHGSLEAYEAWAFDSASYERAQTARGALDRVSAIKGGYAPPPS